MPSILQLLDNLPNFPYYYGGVGNFTSKSVPAGHDRPGGGSSNQPYILRAEGQTWSPSNEDDGTMRLGIIGATERTVADVERITKFFADAPKGPIFLAKQVGLQLTNPKPESLSTATPISTFGNVFSNAVTLPSRIQQDIGATRTYNLGINTLAQVGGVAFGAHFNRHGLLPTSEVSDTYGYIAKANNTLDLNSSVTASAGNRLVSKTAELFDSNDLVVDSYIGGPGSVYGIGSTTINRYVDTIGDKAVEQQIVGNVVPLKVSDLARIGRDGILVMSVPNPTNPQMPSREALLAGTAIIPAVGPAGVTSVSYDTKTTDFRQIKNVLYKTNLPFSDYVSQNIATRIGRGNPGSVGQDRSDYSKSLVGTQDAVNKLSLFYASAPPGTDSGIVDLNSGEAVTAASVRDMIKFRIEAIDNDNPTFSTWMVFRAFVTEFSDSFDGEMNSYKYTGRGERFYVQDGMVRQIGIGFMIAAQSRDEMKPLYQKLNFLMSNMAPDYNSANKMRGSLIKFTLGDYMYRQPGIISNLRIDIQEDYPWEIALNEPEGGKDATMHEVPMILRVSMNFIPIHDFLPRKGASTPFISVNGRKSPSDPLSPPSPNNWLADNGLSKNTDGSPRYTSLQSKLIAAEKAALKANQ